MGGPYPLVLSEESQIPHHEEVHPYKDLVRRENNPLLDAH